MADFDRIHYEILTSYAEESFAEEHFCEIDWLAIEEENRYDIILGHRAINVIGKEVLLNFFVRMYRALKPGGVFYCKGNVFFTGEKDCLNELIDKWAFRQERAYPLFSYIEVQLYFHTADKDGYVVYPEARRVVDDMFQDKRCNAKDYELTRLLVSMSDAARFRGLIHEREVQDIIDKVGFRRSDWIILDRDICKNMPIMRLEK